MAEFLYLYRGGQSGWTPEESQQIMQKWMSWFKELTASGNLKDGGQPLELKASSSRAKMGLHRRSVYRDERSRRRLHAHRGAEPRARGRAREGVSGSRAPRLRRGPSRYENRHVAWSRATISSATKRDAWSPRSRVSSAYRTSQLAEDVVQDAFCRALEVWKLRGVPENPSAWL